MFVEDIKILALKRNISLSELARRLGESPQNYNIKFKRNSACVVLTRIRLPRRIPSYATER